MEVSAFSFSHFVPSNFPNFTFLVFFSIMSFASIPDLSAKDLKLLKKEELIRLILKTRNLNSPNTNKEGNQEDSMSSPMPSVVSHSTEWFSDKIKSAVFEAFQLLKAELHQEVEAKMNRIEEKFTSQIETLQSEIASVKMRVEDSVISLEKDFLYDLRDKEQRKENIMVFGLQESNASSATDSKKDDLALMESLSSKLGVPHLKIKHCFRLGRRDDRSRPLKVICHDPQQRTQLLQSAFRIPRLDIGLGFQKTFIKPDMTPKEQEADRQLRQELRCRRNAGENVVIRRGRIISAAPRAHAIP